MLREGWRTITTQKENESRAELYGTNIQTNTQIFCEFKDVIKSLAFKLFFYAFHKWEI